ncbi:Tfp pilus assembly protein FimT/FimU [Candidatus Margulisiibacteriota bacterium]
MTRKRSGGWTIVELIIVMIVISILATVAAVRFPTSSNRNLISARNQLMKDIRIAQSTAISQQFFCGVYFDFANNKYWLYEHPVHISNIITNPATGQDYIVELSSYNNIELFATSLGGDTVKFNSKGIPFDVPGKLLVEESVTLIDVQSGNTIQIFVLPGTGLVKHGDIIDG